MKKLFTVLMVIMMMFSTVNVFAEENDDSEFTSEDIVEETAGVSEEKEVSEITVEKEEVVETEDNTVEITKEYGEPMLLMETPLPEEPVYNGEVYLSSEGNDDNSGFTINDPILSFNKALQLIQEDGTIYIINDYVDTNNDTSIKNKKFNLTGIRTDGKDEKASLHAIGHSLWYYGPNADVKINNLLVTADSGLWNLISVSGSGNTLTLNDGAELANCYSLHMIIAGSGTQINIYMNPGSSMHDWKNMSASSSGAIYIHSNSKLYANGAKIYNMNSLDDGAGVNRDAFLRMAAYQNGSTGSYAELVNCEIFNMRASSAAVAEVWGDSELVVRNCNIHDCEGGAFDNYEKLTIEDTTFTNIFDEGAGAIKNHGKSLTVNNSSFVDCYSLDDYIGGVMLLYGGSNTVVNGGYFKNAHSADGGVYMVWGDASLTVNGGQYEDCYSVGPGGFIYVTDLQSWSGTEYFDTNVVVNDAKVRNVSATYGGLLYVNGHGKVNIEMNNLTVDGIKANAGGAVYSKNANEMKIKGGSYKHITSANAGGFMYCMDNDPAYGSNVVIDGTNFDSISSGGNGGAIIARSFGKMNISMKDSAISNCTSSDGQGAVYLGYYNTYTGEGYGKDADFISEFVSDNNIIKDNSSKVSGTLTNHGWKSEITNSTFIANTTEGYGGAIALEAGLLNVSNSSIIQNKAKDLGGGIFAAAGTVANINNGNIIYENKSEKGAADVYKARGATVNVLSSVPDMNNTKYTGWYWDQPDSRYQAAANENIYDQQGISDETDDELYLIAASEIKNGIIPEEPENPIIPDTPVPVNPRPVIPQPTPVTPTPEITPEVEPEIIEKPEMEKITEEKSPLANEKDDDGIEKHWALVNLVCMVAGLITSFILLLSKKKDEEEDEETGSTRQKERKGIYKVLGPAVSLISVVAFIFTENMRNPMILVDKYTILMILLLIGNIVTLILGRKYHDENKEEQE